MNWCEAFWQRDKGIEEGQSYLRTDGFWKRREVKAAIQSLNRKAERNEVRCMRGDYMGVGMGGLSW